MAAASKHKVMSYGRMDEAMRTLNEQVKKLLQEAEAIDAAEDRLYGRGRRGDELPEELKDPAIRAERLRQAKRQLEADKKVALAAEKEKRRLKKIRRAKQDLEQEAKDKAEQKGQKPDEAKPEPKAQKNFTDPDFAHHAAGGQVPAVLQRAGGGGCRHAADIGAGGGTESE